MRRILLGFEKLSFNEVSSFAMIYKNYILEGLSQFRKFTLNLEDLELEEGSENIIELINLNKDLVVLEEEMTSTYQDHRTLPSTKWTKKQCDWYVSKQVSLIQNCENQADDPLKIDKIVQDIISNDPDMSQVHYLSYLNSLRIQDFCQAVKSLYWSSDRNCFQSEAFLNPECTITNDNNDKLSEDVDR